jgi:hypothetical protein
MNLETCALGRQALSVLIKQTSWCPLHAVFCLGYSSNLKMETTFFSWPSVDFQRTTRPCIPEDKTHSLPPLWEPQIRHVQSIFSANIRYTSWRSIGAEGGSSERSLARWDTQRKLRLSCLEIQHDSVALRAWRRAGMRACFCSSLLGQTGLP